MGKVFIAGDTHNTIDIGKIKQFAKNEGKDLTKSDVLIVAGDFGVIWDVSITLEEQALRDWYKSLPFTVAFIDGNHENHHRLGKLPSATYFDEEVGLVDYGVYHLKRGRVYNICGYKVWTMGGGYSIDKAWRQEFISWWREELPSGTEMMNGKTSLINEGTKVDFIVTHTAPSFIFDQIAERYDMNHKISEEEENLRTYLENISNSTEFDKWFFGHFHVDWSSQDDKFHCLYNSIYDYENKKFI